MAMRGGGGAGGRQRGALGVLLTGVILGLISVAVAAGNCVDDFDPDPLGAGTYSDVVNTTECGGGFTYTFTSDGDGPDATGGFGINANKLEPKSGAYNTNTTERLTIEQSDGKSFVFNSAWFDLHPSTGGTGFEIIGVGPEPFDSVFTGGPGSGPGVYGPADPKLVTRIEIYSVDFYLDWIDNVDVEITAPGIGIYDGATLVTNEVPADVVDVGSTAVGSPIDKILTIQSIGGAALDLTGSPYVTLSDDTHFQIQAQPSTDPIASGSSTNFTVRFNPASSGVKTATVTILNDSEASPYQFQVEGEGTGAPEMDVEGNGNPIADGSTTPELSNWTDFGDVPVGGQWQRTFTIENTGNAALTLTDFPTAVQLSSNPSGDFSVIFQPSSGTVAASGSDTFVVRCGPSGAGARTATVSIANNDADENPYNFDITCNGTDTVKPDVTIDQAGGQADPTNASPVTFTAVFDEPINDATFTSVDVSVGGTATTGAVTVTEIAPLDDTTFEVSIPVTADGTVIPTIPAGGIEDPSGNTNNASTSTDNSITYDATPPGKPDSPDLDAGSDLGELQTDNITNDDTPTFFGLAGSVEGSATVEIRSSVAGALDTFLANGDGSWTYTVPGGSALAEGSHQIDIRAIDAAGNIGDYSDALTVLIDTTPPSVPTGLNPTDGEYTNDVPVTLSWSASSDPGGSGLRSTETYRYVVDGGSSGYTANTQYEPSLSEGDYVWRVRARDVAGNNSSYTTDRDLYIDTTDPNDPTPSSSSHAVGVPSKVTTIDIDIAFAGDEDPLSNGVSSGLDGFDTAFDKSPTWAATETLDEQETWTGGPFSATSDGSWYFHIATCDNAGNWTSTEHLGPFDIDTVPPSVVSVDASPTTVTDATVGSDTFTVTVVFNETMDTGTTPTLVYAPDVASGGTATITNGSGAWSDTNTTNDTYTVTYDVDDHDVDEDSVTIDVTGAKDVAQNDQNNYDPPVHEFAIDTANPKIQVNDINPSDTVVSDLDVGAGTFEVEVVYNESMNTGVTPTIAFTPNAEAGTLTLASDGWSDTVVTNDTYTATYNVADAGVTQLGVDIAVTGGEDLVGNVQDPASEADEFDVDTENPEFASFTVDGGLVDGGVPGGNCEITIDFDARATDANRSITAPCATIVDVTIIGNATEGTSTIVSQTQDGATAVDVAGTVEVSDLMSCPANVEVTLEITDDAGNTTQDMVRGADIDDVVVPVVSDLEFNTDATYTVQETDYDVDDCCEVTVYFSANVTDNCCIAWQNVGVTVTLPTGNAVLETINVQRAQTSDKRVDITGSAVVRCLTSCPARVEVEITATDCCGNAAVTQTTTAGEGLVWDNTDPVPNHDPLQHTYEDDRLDELDVRLDEYYVYRLVIRENTPERIDVIANDNDNCSLCTCCGTMWIDAITDAPDRGTATIEVDNGDCNGGSVIRYAPDRGYLGPDYFEYTVRDACGNVSAPVTVYLQMVEETVMEDVSVTTCEGETVEFRVAAADLWVDRDPVTIPFTFTIVSGPTHGALAGNVAELTYTPPSMRTDPNTRELVPTFDFTETGAIDLSYTPAEGFTGRDAVMIRFEDPFGAFDIARVDILVIPCETAAEGAAILRVGPEMILPIIVPESFRAIVETTPEAVILISHATGHVYPSALRVAWDESMNRHVLFLDTGPLPEGLYRLTIPLGTGAIVDLTIEVGETE